MIAGLPVTAWLLLLAILIVPLSLLTAFLHHHGRGGRPRGPEAADTDEAGGRS